MRGGKAGLATTWIISTSRTCSDGLILLQTPIWFYAAATDLSHFSLFLIEV